jgi:hypothetical protein
MQTLLNGSECKRSAQVFPAGVSGAVHSLRESTLSTL